MYDWQTLKPEIEVDESHVDCPVEGCSCRVVRQRRHFRALAEFQCPEHHIFISPTTFQYPCVPDNLLWNDENDLQLLKDILGNKRESRMARDNSEDALSWNVFRFLETHGHLPLLLSRLLGRDFGPLQLVYWSHDAAHQDVWPELVTARREFGEQPQGGSEPDLIAYNDEVVLFIEAKLTAGNRTTLRNPKVRKKYLTGGEGWFDKAFKSNFETIALADKQYELLRFWLLGSWIAAQSGREFYLLNLVRADYEQDIEQRFGDHIQSDPVRRFRRITWEGIYRTVKACVSASPERNSLLDYLKFKTVGYSHHHRLQRAFSLPLEPDSDS